MKLAAYWVGLAIAILGSQWVYQPTLELALISSLLLFLLSLIVGWSATKLGPGFWGFIKTLVVATVAGVMHNQAMDIFYVGFAAPAGARLEFYFEVVTAAVFLASTASLLRLLTIGPEIEKQSGRDQSE
jgi:hypothetical protein